MFLHPKIVRFLEWTGRPAKNNNVFFYFVNGAFVPLLRGIDFWFEPKYMMRINLGVLFQQCARVGQLYKSSSSMPAFFNACMMSAGI